MSGDRFWINSWDPGIEDEVLRKQARKDTPNPLSTTARESS